MKSSTNIVPAHAQFPRWLIQLFSLVIIGLVLQAALTQKAIAAEVNGFRSVAFERVQFWNTGVLVNA